MEITWQWKHLKEPVVMETMHHKVTTGENCTQCGGKKMEALLNKPFDHQPGCRWYREGYEN